MWDIDYKSTSDEEDNDSDEEEYPKAHSKPKEDKKKDKPSLMDDMAMKIIASDKALVRRDLEARLKRVQRIRSNLKKFRVLSNLEESEVYDFDKSEDYSWWQGVDDRRGIYFAMGTKFSSRYSKGDQLFNCYGRRTNRFLLTNYGFCLRFNKYNSLGFKVFVTNKPDPGSAPAEPQKFQKVIKLKMNRLSLDLLQYLRANLIFTFQFKGDDRSSATVSTPVHLDFECHMLTQAIALIDSILRSQYKTTYEHDLCQLELLAEDKMDVKNPWRYKLALIHRANQKEILICQRKLCCILKAIIVTLLDRANQGNSTSADFKRAYLLQVPDQETAEEVMKHRLTLRNYLMELKLN